MLYFSHDISFKSFVSLRPLSGKLSTRAKSGTKEQRHRSLNLSTQTAEGPLILLYKLSTKSSSKTK